MAGRSNRKKILYRFKQLREANVKQVQYLEEILALSQGSSVTLIKNVPLLEGAYCHIDESIKIAEQDFSNE